MAQTFLTIEDLKQAELELKPLTWPQTRDERLIQPESSNFSGWLQSLLMSKINKASSGDKVELVFLGSFSRDELCPYSDIDLLLLGEDKNVLKFIKDLRKLNIPFRYRKPENSKNLFEGVDVFDHLSLLRANLGEGSLSKDYGRYKDKFFSSDKFLTRFRLEIVSDRERRKKQYDTLANYLQPNLKYGYGGLRDIQQALDVIELYPELFKEVPWVKSLFVTYKSLFINVRQKLHLLKGQDILDARSQGTIAKWYDYSESAQFMQQLMKGLERTQFYSDWVFFRLATNDSRPLNDDGDKHYFMRLLNHPNLNSSFLIRSTFPDWCMEVNKAKLFALFIDSFDSGELTSEKFNYVFRSKGLHLLVEDLFRLEGLVQHDQYHRYSVSEHIYKAIYLVLQAKESKLFNGKIQNLCSELDSLNWKILFLAALFHDLAKGMGGHHSEKGEGLVETILKSFNQSDELIKGVGWLVKNHLLMSRCAFRLNPNASSTWQVMHEAGAQDDRLKLLTIFTAIDIIATNPEAWNPWKETLLLELYERLGSKGVKSYNKLLSNVDESKQQAAIQFFSKLDLEVIEHIPKSYLLQDFNDLFEQKENLSLLFYTQAKGDYWVRFHSLADASGLFLHFVQMLHSVGCNISECYVQTLSNFGVYDWFHIKVNHSVKVIQKRLSHLSVAELSSPKVSFTSISLLSRDKDEVVLLFKGTNKKYALSVIAKAMLDLGQDIRWAKVQKWGNRVEDIFALDQKSYTDEVLQLLNDRLSVK